jgi:hypothetical protein
MNRYVIEKKVWAVLKFTKDVKKITITRRFSEKVNSVNVQRFKKIESVDS